MKRVPFRVDTYCGCCHLSTAHYHRQDIFDEKRDCFECSRCKHLIFVPKGESEAVGLAWYETRKAKS